MLKLPCKKNKETLVSKGLSQGSAQVHIYQETCCLHDSGQKVQLILDKRLPVLHAALLFVRTKLLPFWLHLLYMGNVFGT